MPDTTQATRLLSVTTPLAYDELLMKQLYAIEGLSQLFQFQLDLLHAESEDGFASHQINHTSLLGQPMCVTVNQADGAKRYFHGICASFSQGRRSREWSKYQAVLVPKAWFLTQVFQSRIFQQKSVPDILSLVLGSIAPNYRLSGHYEQRNYCVQYRESDWDFASRLMEEEGIYYYFEHTENDHTLIIADAPAAHQACPTKERIPHAVNRSSDPNEWAGSVTEWEVDNRTLTGKYTVWDNNFQLVNKNLDRTQTSRYNVGKNTALEIYDYPGGYAKQFDGISSGGGEQNSELQKIFEQNAHVASVRQQELDTGYINYFGKSDCCAITPGYKAELFDGRGPMDNGTFVFVTVKTQAVQTPSYRSDRNVPKPYENTIVALEMATPFRPKRKVTKPIVHGSQTAVVVGPPGEEIFTDKYGRVKVQFRWDRAGQYNESSSCWLRVAQMWAGKKWGTMFIPRIGMEVLVDFIDGDPDQPIIVGALYNPENMPPYTLPDEKTKSTIKSNSSKGGGGFNEIRLEDKAGSEQIFIHGQKDQDIRIKNDCKEIILHDRHLIVENEQVELVKKDKHLEVKGNQNEKVGGTVSLNAGSDLQQKAGMNHALEAGMGVHIKAGTTAVIEAGAMLTLKVGGNFININSAGIFIKGTMVMINSGGAAGSGAGCSPEAPKAAKEADTANPGERAAAPPSVAPPAPLDLGPFARMMAGAAQNATPFCSICG